MFKMKGVLDPRLLMLMLCVVVVGVVADGDVDASKSVQLNAEGCHPSYFECKNGLCVKGDARCNHVKDCTDGSDEMDCGVKSAPTSCPQDEYLCRNPPACITIDDLCSDYNHCGDYDAIDTLCPITCQPHKFECVNVSQCVLKKHICDGSNDCMDGSDELGCDDEKYKCEEDDSFQCDDKSSCIFATDVCDGHAMCDDGSDEKNDCYELCKAKKCGENQLCLPVGQGVKCACRDGYRFDQNNNCVEYNHCNVSDIDRPCSQMCIEGRFGRGPQCRCIYGYSLGRDGTSCEAVGSPPVLYLATASEIHEWSFETESFSTLIDGLKGVKGLAIDSLGRRIFWSENGGDGSQPEVFSMEIEGGKKSIAVIASFILRKPEGLAYDYITKNLYIVDSGIPAILTCELYNNHCVTAFNSSMVNSPKDIVLDPAQGVLYYTEVGNEPAIMRGSMDGERSEVLVSNIHQPKSLHLDHTTNRLYWIDSLYSSGYVFRVDLDGTNKKPVLTHKIKSPALLSIFEDRMYWVNNQNKSLMAANKFNGDSNKSLFQFNHPPMALTIDHKSLQNDYVVNRCHSKRCHLCLLNDEESGSCFCARGYQASHTQQYCEKAEASSFLLVSDETQILRIPLYEPGRPTPTYIKTSRMRRVNKLAYLPKSHSILYSGLNMDSATARASIRMIPEMDSWTHRSVNVIDVNSVINIAVDEASSIVFWTDYEKRSIRIASLDGAYNTTLPINTVEPTALCVDPAQGTLYFSDVTAASRQAVIKRCRLDGQSCSTLVSGRLQFPNHLLVEGQQVYWSDYRLGEISTIDQWGNDRETLVVADGYPISFAIDSGILYWIEDGKKSIFYKHIHSQGQFEGQIEAEMANPQGLIAVVPYSLPETACTTQNGECEQICISVERSTESTCMCSEGFRLHQDKKRCVRDGDQCEGHLCRVEDLCLSQDQVCDGKVDCQDRSDEFLCPIVQTCFNHDFQCANGKCIPENFKCDGDDDCKDKSDERPDLCSRECPPGNHVCDGVKCLPSQAVCDRFPDCDDGSDEVPCGGRTCSADEFSCGEDQCLSMFWVCDGDKDCTDGEDERNCEPDVCGDGEFVCNDGDCIDKLEVCDSFDTCMEGEDEAGCPPRVQTCHESEYECLDGECIHWSARCDGTFDCSGHEDEYLCKDLCTVDQYQCENGKCISLNLHCDGKTDCEDGSDETSGCESIVEKKPPSDPLVMTCKGFTCGNGHCVDVDKRCNGMADCVDNTDEVNCAITCRNFHNCSQICVDSAFGVSCECEPGYRLKNGGLVCDDIDECQEQNGGCSQKCINLKGLRYPNGPGVKCQCFEGYKLGQDYYSCKVKGRRPNLYVASLHGLKKISYKGQHKQEVTLNEVPQPALTLDIDIHRGSFFWVQGEIKTRLFQSYHLGKGQAHPQHLYNDNVLDLDVDWITGNVYLMTLAHRFVTDNNIVVVKSVSNGNSSSVVAHTLIRSTRDERIVYPLALHPPKAYMFFREDNSGILYRASMDGKERVEMRLASSHIKSFDYATVDVGVDRLYWRENEQLMSVTIDDKDFLVYNLPSRGGENLEVFEGLAYIAKGNSIVSFPLHKGGKQGFTTVFRVLRPDDFKIDHPLKQPMVPNPCDRKACMYMCVLSGIGRASCVCPDGVNGTSNNQDCQGAQVPLERMFEIGVIVVNADTTTPIMVKQPQDRSTRPYRQHQEQQEETTQSMPLSFVPSFTCSIPCLNGGTCISKNGFLFCRCHGGFEGARCEREKEHQDEKMGTEEDGDGNSLAWVAGLVVGLVLMIVLVVMTVWYIRYKRHNQSLISSIRFKKQNKFVICNQDDKDGLVPEISFGNPGFQEEIDEEAHMHEDQDWWKKLLSRSKRTVDSPFHHKNSVADDGGCVRGDPQDPVMSDKVRLLK